MMTDDAIGLDIGTTSIKMAVVDGSGTVKSLLRAPTPWIATTTGREMWAEDLFAVVDMLLDQAPLSVQSIGVTSMGQSGTVFTRDGESLAPIVSWDDRRARPAAAELAAEWGSDFSARTGLPVDASWTVCQLRQSWRNQRLPESSVWLGVADAVAWHLTRRAQAELSLACQSGLVDLVKRAWSNDLLDWAGVPAEIMPPLRDSGTAVGLVYSGKLEGARVAIAGHDHLAAAVGAGAIQADTLYDSCGTAETLMRVTVPELVIPRIGEIAGLGLQVGWHVLQGQAVVAASHQASWALERVRHLLGQPFDALEGATECGSAEVVGAMGSQVTVRADVASHLEVWAAAQDAVAREAGRLAREMDAVCGPAMRTVVAGRWSSHKPFVAARARYLPCVSAAEQADAGALGAAMLSRKTRN
jgi:sugar (pentulose or hexulose) kinase